jgi:hypothetical protein
VLPENPLSVVSGNDAPTKTSPGVLAKALIVKHKKLYKIKALSLIKLFFLFKFNDF